MTVSSKISEAADKAEKTLNDSEKSLRELVERAEAVLQEGLELIKSQTRTYADTAGEQLDSAQRLVAERVRERPLTSTATAVGVGVLIGLILSSGRGR